MPTINNQNFRRENGVTSEKVTSVLKQVYDPEIQIDVWSMGLIYKLDVNQKTGAVHILMTLTSPMCPYGPMLLEEIRTRLKDEADATDVTIEVTFDPPWKPSEELRAMLGV